jgi:predicted permease
MDIFLITFQAVGALLGIGVLGFWIIGKRHVPGNALGVLNSIAIDIALPCLLMSNILTHFSPDTFPNWWQMPLWWLGFTILALALSLGFSLWAKKSTRGEFAMSLFFPNGIFFPLIIISGIYGGNSPYLVLLFFITLFQPSVVFGSYPFFIRNKQSEEKLRWTRLINPIVVVTMISIALVFAGVKPYIPDFVFLIVNMVGATATPLLMLILGGNIYNDFMNRKEGENKLQPGEVIKFVLIKNLIFPAIVLAILVWIRADNVVAFLLVIQAAVPPISAIPVLVDRLKGNRAFSNQILVASFALSIITIPAFIYLFSRFFEMPLK